MSSSSLSDKRNCSADGVDGGDRSSDWAYKTNEMESDNYSIRDITDRHVENFLTGIKHELVEKLMITFTKQSIAITNEIHTEIIELKRKHQKEQNALEDELQKLKDELMQNAVELEDFIAND